MTEDLQLGAVRLGEVGHVLDDTDDLLISLSCDGTRALSDLGCSDLRGRHNQNFSIGQELRDRDCNIAGTGRHIDEQNI